MALEDGLVAICPPREGVPVGAGLRVKCDLVLTCAHVVNDALGRAQREPRRPPEDAKVSVRQHSPGAPSVVASVDTAGDAWSGPPAERQLGADLCLLRLASGQGIDTGAIQFRDISGRLLPVPFRAAGFPRNWDVDPALGLIVLRDEHGLYILRPDPIAHAVISALTKHTFLRGEQRPPGIIHKGFSGGPVEVEGAIVGLVATSRSLVAEATAYMIPVSAFPKCVAADANTGVPGAYEELAEDFAAPETIKLLETEYGSEAVFDAILGLWSGSDPAQRGRLCHAAGLLVCDRAREFLTRVQADQGEEKYVRYLASGALASASMKGEKR